MAVSVVLPFLHGRYILFEIEEEGERGFQEQVREGGNYQMSVTHCSGKWYPPLPAPPILCAQELCPACRKLWAHSSHTCSFCSFPHSTAFTPPCSIFSVRFEWKIFNGPLLLSQLTKIRELPCLLFKYIWLECTFLFTDVFQTSGKEPGTW